MNKKLAEQYFVRARDFFERKKFGEALPLLDILDEAFPNSKSVIYARGRCLAAMGRVDEARSIGEYLVDVHGAHRGQALLAQLENEGEGAAEAGGPWDTNLDGGLARGAGTRLRPAARKGLSVTWTFILVFGVVSISGVSAYRYRAFGAPNDVAALDPEELRRTLESGRRAREAGRLTRAEARSTAAGQVRPEAEWRLTAIDGVPDWKSGVYKNVPSVGAPERTINVYLPMAYDEKVDALFPTLAITMPGGNPGFLQLEDWAERREVILIALNSSRNAWHSTNYIAQDAAINTVMPTMRIDERLGFAIGTSGGAQTAWWLAVRYPENVAGIVMMAQGGYRKYMISPHTRVAYINGRDDWNHDFITEMVGRVRANGNEVRRKVIPGGHITAPLHLRIEMLDWMLSAARRDFGLK